MLMMNNRCYRSLVLSMIFTCLLVSVAHAEDLYAGIYYVDVTSEIAKNIYQYMPEGGGLNLVFVSEKQTNPSLYLTADSSIEVTFWDEGAV